MAFVTSERMLLDAKEGKYAIGAFNVENMEMVKAVIRAAEEMKAPVMLQTTPSTINYGGLKTYFANVKAEAEHASIPVALHLDHGNSFDLAIEAIREGYTSIMIDGSAKVFEENVKLTKRVVDVAKISQIPVEAELGKIAGKEDDLVVEEGGYTDPLEAKEFVERTGITSLAIAIGTAHGLYTQDPVLDKERVSEIRALVDIPLVLHGGSGLDDDDVKECIQRGICKINFATELRIAYTDGIKEVLRKDPDEFDPKVFGRAGMERVRDMVIERIKLCGSQGKANID